MKTISVLLDSDLNLSLRILSGVQESLSSFPDVRVVPLHYNQTETLEHLLDLGNVQGVVGAFLGDRWLERLLRFKVPIVNVGAISEIRSIPSVTADFYQAGVLAARHFADNGWKRTALVHERALFASRQLNEGFLSEATANQMPPVVLPDGVICSDAVSLEAWLAQLPENTGCFCTSDFLARQVAHALNKINRRVPDSIGIIGVGDSMLDSVLASVTLSSIVIPDKQIGLRAATILMNMLNTGTRTAESEKIPPLRIIVRESSAFFQYADPIVNKAIAYMVSNLFSPCGTEELAHNCGASKRSLEMRFQTIFGHAPATEWRRRRHREICRLLTDTRIPLQDIATLSGTTEPANFWNAFKKTEGTTPAKYRQARMGQ